HRRPPRNTAGVPGFGTPLVTGWTAAQRAAFGAGRNRHACTGPTSRTNRPTRRSSRLALTCLMRPNGPAADPRYLAGDGSSRAAAGDQLVPYHDHGEDQQDVQQTASGE